MGKIRKHVRVKLIAGLIFKDQKIFLKAKSLLAKKFGPLDYQSGVLPFNHTSYYENELGLDLKRAFVSFKNLISPAQLPRIKTATNAIENKTSQDKNRLINIDPGYLEFSKVVLASTKDYKHRIYLDRGIYAEITLYYQDKTFRPWEWTYPDYKTKEYIDIFNQIREIYAGQQ